MSTLGIALSKNARFAVAVRHYNFCYKFSFFQPPTSGLLCRGPLCLDAVAVLSG